MQDFTILSAQPHDALFRLTFSGSENAAALFQHLLPALLAAEMDWPTLRLEPSAYVSAVNLATQQGDLLFSARLQRDPSYVVFLAIEHQSDQTRGSNLPFRFLGYHMAHWNRLASEDAPENAQRLPAVLSALVHHGETPMAHVAELCG